MTTSPPPPAPWASTAAISTASSSGWGCAEGLVPSALPTKTRAQEPLPRNGPQRSGYSAGMVFGFMPHSFPPQKRGPRSRGGAAVTERTSTQRAFRRHDARGFLKEQRSEEHTSELQSRGHLVCRLLLEKTKD